MITTTAPEAGQLGRLHCLRAIAALGVLYHHLGQFSSVAFGSSYGLPASGLLWTGVDLFFVLSGFLMMWTTDGKPGGHPQALAFLLTRAARIYPMYWIVLIGTFFLAVLVPAALPTGPLCSLVCQITLLPQNNEFLIGPAWTLSFEMTFYALFAVFVLLPPSARIRMLAVWTAIVCVLGGFITTDFMLVHHVYTPLVLEFLAGVWIAVLLRRGVRLDGRLAILVASTSLLVGAAAFNHLSRSLPPGIAEWTRVALCGGPAAIIIWWVASRDNSAPIVPHRHLLKLGDNSYAIYLIHWPLVVVFATLAPAWQLPSFIRFAAYIIICPVLTIWLSGMLTKFVGAPAQRHAKSAIGLMKAP